MTQYQVASCNNKYLATIVNKDLNVDFLRALGATFLGLPVVVARAHSFVPIIPWGHTQAFGAAFLAEKHAGLVVLGLAAPP